MESDMTNLLEARGRVAGQANVNEAGNRKESGVIRG